MHMKRIFMEQILREALNKSYEQEFLQTFSVYRSSVSAAADFYPRLYDDGFLSYDAGRDLPDHSG